MHHQGIDRRHYQPVTAAELAKCERLDIYVQRHKKAV
jgi:hypothetical protein